MLNKPITRLDLLGSVNFSRLDYSVFKIPAPVPVSLGDSYILAQALGIVNSFLKKIFTAKQRYMYHIGS